MWTSSNSHSYSKGNYKTTAIYKTWSRPPSPLPHGNLILIPYLWSRYYFPLTCFKRGNRGCAGYNKWCKPSGLLMNKAQSQPGTSAFSFQMYHYYKASIAKGTREDSETVTGVLLYRTPASCEVSGQSRWMSLQKAKGLGLPRWPDGPWPRSWCIHMLVNDICYFQFPAFTVTQRPSMEFLLREVFLSYFLWFSININWS